MGAIQELTVAADLLGRGFQVFRALSAACDCDLAVLLGKRLIRVEVTTGYLSPSGKLQHPCKNQDRFDALAVVAEKSIHYFPPVQNWKNTVLAQKSNEPAKSQADD